MSSIVVVHSASCRRQRILIPCMDYVTNIYCETLHRTPVRLPPRSCWTIHNYRRYLIILHAKNETIRLWVDGWAEPRSRVMSAIDATDLKSLYLDNLILREKTREREREAVSLRLYRMDTYSGRTAYTVARPMEPVLSWRSVGISNKSRWTFHLGRHRCLPSLTVSLCRRDEQVGRAVSERCRTLIHGLASVHDRVNNRCLLQKGLIVGALCLCNA